MTNVKRKVGLAASLLALLAAGPALASGGVPGGGGTGGGGAGGGGGATATTPAPTSCAQITSFSNTTGYYSVWAAIWSKFNATTTCSSTVTWQMTFTNGNTGSVDFMRYGQLGGSTSLTIDEDWGAFSTPYTVTLTLTDASGTVLDSKTALVTTKVGKQLVG